MSHVFLQAYLSTLGLFSLLSRPSFNDRAHAHLSCVLVCFWITYIHRSVWPLAEIDYTPVDGSEGSFLWAQLWLLTISGIIIPLFVPRRYTPANHEVGTHTSSLSDRPHHGHRKMLFPTRNKPHLWPRLLCSASLPRSCGRHTGCLICRSNYSHLFRTTITCDIWFYIASQ